jgi:hypothetical protein
MKGKTLIAAFLAGAVIGSVSSSGAAGRSCEVAHLVGGHSGYCALRLDGRVACWGDEAYQVPYAPSPEGRFVQVAVGYHLACGVREDGHGVCWGKDSSSNFELEGEFLQLQPGIGSVGVLLPDGAIGFIPVGSTSVGETNEGPFVQLSELCAIRSARTVYCYGSEEPAGTFESLAGLCGIAEGGQLECWDQWEGLFDPPPDLRFRHVSSGISPHTGACAVTQDGVAMCAGQDLITQAEPDEQFREVAYGYGWPWGLTTDGRLVPWVPDEPDPIVGGSRAIVGDFAQIAAGGDGLRPFTCAVEHSGHVECWGNTQYQSKTTPDGEFTEVGVGAYHACGLRDDKTIDCWGHEDGLEDTSPPNGQFTRISIGYFGPNCARRTNGTVACWGYGEQELEVPAGAFVNVVAGGQRACALRGDGEATCWRYVEGETVYDIVYEPIDAPDGPFRQLATYFDPGATKQDSHLCGLRTNGQVVCWTDEQGVDPWDPPGGTFAKLSDTGGHACGVRTNGQIECWGPDWIDLIDEPEGEFVNLASGSAHVCGLTSDGTIVCAGNDQTVSLCAASLLCGNGDVDDSESCDDGDTSFSPGDACTGSCSNVPCGQPVHPEANKPLASDALFALQAAVGAKHCSPNVCDVDASSTVSSSDALAILRKSVDPNRNLNCA